MKLEAGETEFDFWMLTLSRITVELGVPCRTLICDKGERGKQFQFAHETPTGTIIGKVRQSKSKTIKQMATVADIEIEIYKVMMMIFFKKIIIKKNCFFSKDIENGKSEIERWSKLLLHIAEILDTRVFEFLYPGHRIERPEQFASTTATQNNENVNDDDNDNDNEDK